MKKLNVKRMLNLRSFALVGIFAIAVLAASCNKQDDIPEPIYQDVELKKGKPADKPGAPEKGEMTIAQIVAADDGEFDQLQGALEATGLLSVFEGTDQYTVFAPTDAAFEAALAVLESKGIEVTPELLTTVLLYHVTDGRRASNSVVPKNGERVIESLMGETFSVKPDLSIEAVGNSANIIAEPKLFDISASNGIIHVIDAVILPIELPQD